MVLAPIYAARETDTLGISSDDIRIGLDALGTSARSLSTFEEIAAYVLEHAKEGDLVITMGAGDIYRVADMLLKSRT